MNASKFDSLILYLTDEFNKATYTNLRGTILTLGLTSEVDVQGRAVDFGGLLSALYVLHVHGIEIPEDSKLSDLRAYADSLKTIMNEIDIIRDSMYMIKDQAQQDTNKGFEA